MRFEHTVVHERHTAVRANVRLLLRVDSLVYPVGFVRLEPLAAHFALEVPRIGVCCRVLLEIGPANERNRWIRDQEYRTLKFSDGRDGLYVVYTIL